MQAVQGRETVMGRTYEGRDSRISITLSSMWAKIIKDAAAQKGIPVSHHIEEAVRRYHMALTKVQEGKLTRCTTCFNFRELHISGAQMISDHPCWFCNFTE